MPGPAALSGDDDRTRNPTNIVRTRKKNEAWCFPESPAFYAEWLHDDDPDMLAELRGPVLNVGSPQSELADEILELFRKVLMTDERYIARVKRHYQMFRDKVDGRSRRRSRRGVLSKKKRHK